MDWEQCQTDRGWQGREFSPTHYTSASSAYTCVANRVVRLQDRLSEDMRKAGLYYSPMCSDCNGQHAATLMRSPAVKIKTMTHRGMNATSVVK